MQGERTTAEKTIHRENDSTEKGEHDGGREELRGILILETMQRW